MYLINVETNTLNKNKQIVFVELINPEKQIVKRQNVLIEDGVSFSYFKIEDSLICGNYQIRVFTSFNKFFNSEYFSTKNIFIYTSNFVVSSNFMQNYSLYNKKKYSIISESFEGRNKNFVFYKINYQNEFDVYLENKHKNILSKISNNKIGIFDFYYDKIEKNYLILKYRNKVFKKVLVPVELIKNNLVEFIDNTDELLLFFNNSNDEFLVEVENQGVVYKSLSIKKSLNIKKSDLKPGISKIKISKNSKYINEFYFQNVSITDSFSLNFFSDKVILKNTSKSDFFITIYITNDTNNSSFFKNSYFSNEVPFIYSDYCSTYNFSEVEYLLKNKKYQYIYDILDTLRVNYVLQQGINIKGTVSKVIEKNFSKNFELKLSILNSFNDVFYTKTDDNGIFEFKDLFFYDSLYFLIEGIEDKKIKTFLINVFPYDTAKIFFNPYKNIDITKYKVKTIKNNNRDQNKPIYGDADNSFYAKEIENSGASNIFEFLNGRVPGLKVNNNIAIIRGVNSFISSNEPLYLINNIPVDKFAIEDIDLNSVERIDVVKSASKSSIYGQRGANGIVSVYTKQGYNIQWGYYKSKIPGISRKSKFAYRSSANKFQTFEWIPFISLSSNDSIIIHIKQNQNCFLKINGITSTGKIIDIVKPLNK